MIRLRSYALPVALAFAAGVAFRDQAQEWKEFRAKPLPAQEVVYRAVLCPNGQWIAQRYDTWGRGKDFPIEIKQKQWIRHCT